MHCAWISVLIVTVLISFYIRNYLLWRCSYTFLFDNQFSSVQSLSRVQLFATPWITARQASLSIFDIMYSTNRAPTRCQAAFQALVIQYIFLPSWRLLFHVCMRQGRGGREDRYTKRSKKKCSVLIALCCWIS